jgi:hypothetical protein
MENVSVTASKRSCGFVRSFVRLCFGVACWKKSQKGEPINYKFWCEREGELFVVVVRRSCDKAQKDSIAALCSLSRLSKEQNAFSIPFLPTIPIVCCSDPIIIDPSPNLWLAHGNLLSCFVPLQSGSDCILSPCICIHIPYDTRLHEIIGIARGAAGRLNIVGGWRRGLYDSSLG